MDNGIQWKVEIIGDSTDLSALAERLSGTDTNVSRDGESYILSSSEFDPAWSADAVREKAQEIIDFLNAASYLALDSARPIRMGSLYRVRDDRTRDIYVTVEPMRLKVRVFAPTVVITHPDGAVEEFRPADPIPEWIPVAQNDQSVALVFRILATHDLNWINLYKIFEIVQQECGGMKAIDAAGWATIRSMALFKHTANSLGAIGLDARHGVETTQSPKQPMSLSEARSLIKTIVLGWLRFKSTEGAR